MRFAVVSDIHGNLAAIQAVLADIDGLEHPVEVIACAGDIVGHAPEPNEVIDLLRSRKIESVRGNYDEVAAGSRIEPGTDYASEQERAVDVAAVRWTRQHLTPENAEYLQGLPRELRIQVSASGRTAVRVRKTDDSAAEIRKGFLMGSLGGSLLSSARARPGGAGKRIRPQRVLVVHGSPRDTVEYLYPGTAQSVLRTIAQDAQAEIVVYGHTHQPFQQVVNGVAFIGVGSVGRPRGGGDAEYTIVEVAGTEIDVEFRSVAYDVEAEADAIARSGLPPEMAERLRPQG